MADDYLEWCVYRTVYRDTPCRRKGRYYLGVNPYCKQHYDIIMVKTCDVEEPQKRD